MYTIKNNKAIINEYELVLKNKIYESLEISNMLILLMVTPEDVFYNENVLGICLNERKVKWEIGNLDYGTETYCPFVGIKYLNNRLYLNNSCDITIVVDPLTGDVLDKGIKQKY